MQFLYLADQHQTERGPNPVCERLLVGCPIGPHPREYSPIERDSCDTNLKEARVFCTGCQDKKTPDLYSEPECLNSVVSL